MHMYEYMDLYSKTLSVRNTSMHPGKGISNNK